MSYKPFRISVPGSKSITQRALVCAALASGRSRLSGPLDSEDTSYLRSALTALGVEIDDSAPGHWVVNGSAGTLSAPSGPIYMGNNGTGIRFMISVAALAPKGAVTELTGNRRMEERPAAPLLRALSDWGVRAESIKGTGCPPIRIEGGGIEGGKTAVAASISSQFLSSLLLVAPYCRRPAVIGLDGPLVSRPYVDITTAVMKAFGVEVSERDNAFFVPQGAYEGRQYLVEGDASSASYFFAAAAVTGSAVTVTNLPPEPLQGDAAFADILGSMGCRVEKDASEGTTVIGPEQGRLSAIEIDMGRWPDVVPTLAVVAAFAQGTTVVRNVAHLRVKETDRITAVVNELNRIGVEAGELEDGLWVKGAADPNALRGALIQTYDDHRIAMSFAVAGLRVAGIEFQDKSCVKKSFPDFWQRWQELVRAVRQQG